MTDKHPRCGERLDCPCWRVGAQEEAAIRRARPVVRELTDYIRAIGDAEPTLTIPQIVSRLAAIWPETSA